MEDTPAAVDRQTGILYINPKLYFNLTPFQQKFVKLHEYGHYNLNTDSELEADEYAFKQLAGTEFRSLKQCIECLEQLLDEKKIGHKIRIDKMYDLAIQWDKDNPQVNKMSGAETQDTANAYSELLMTYAAGSQKQLSTTLNSLNNMLNSLLITAVLIVAMIFILKDV